MNKLWEENLVSNALQEKVALKIEQLGVAEEKSVAQNTLYAVTKRKLNSVEAQLDAAKERIQYLSRECEDYSNLLNKDVVRLRDDVREELQKNFLFEFQRNLPDLTKARTEGKS